MNAALQLVEKELNISTGDGHTSKQAKKKSTLTAENDE